MRKRATSRRTIEFAVERYKDLYVSPGILRFIYSAFPTQRYAAYLRRPFVAPRSPVPLALRVHRANVTEHMYGLRLLPLSCQLTATNMARTSSTVTCCSRLFSDGSGALQ